MNWSSRTTSKNSEWLRKVQEEKGIKVKTLEDEPVLGPHLYWVWKAFTELNLRRPAGMGGPSYIPYTEIEAYCRVKGIWFQSDRSRLLKLVDALDREWMRQYLEKEAKDTKKPTASPPPSHNPPRGGGRRPPPRQPVR